MKKIIFVILLAFISGYSFAQQIGIDGFILGSSRTAVALNASKKGVELGNDKNNEIIYSKCTFDPTTCLSYAFYFESGKLYKIEKNEQYQRDNQNLFKGYIRESNLNIVLDYGEPTTSGDSYFIWRIEKNKIAFRYDIVSQEVPDGANYFLKGKTKTLHLLTIETTVE
ncbi:MAG: hypothetical protein FWC41_06230 [Firmicutes bacterium]|nr:hypothetical protein [Bacillota bacterium]